MKIHKSALMPDPDNAAQGFAVGDYVHCRHAQAEGIVSEVYNLNVVVRVTAACGSNYTVGCEYAWLPTQLVSMTAPEMN